MKGLASTSPAFARVGICARSARKHYGVCSTKEFEETKHEVNRRSVISLFRNSWGMWTDDGVALGSGAPLTVNTESLPWIGSSRRYISKSRTSIGMI